MKAIQYKSYGGSEVLIFTETAKPQIRNLTDVLIRVKAATVNPYDIKIRSGLLQKTRPIKFPFVPGSDASGIVEDVGSEATQFKPGDEVMAYTPHGAYAGYLVVKKDNISLKPDFISFAEAASLVVPIGTAQSVLFNEGKLQKGQKVFIQGASGAVGTMMIQMAKAHGAYVIGTASGKGLELLKALGADEAVDYKTQDFTSVVQDADLVVDCVGGETLVKLFQVVRKGGKLLSIIMPPPVGLAQKHEVEIQYISSDLSGKNLEPGLKLLKEGKIKPVISKTFRLEEAAQAQDFVSAGSVNGKVVLLVG